ncbi:START domain protein [Dictyocaulus viviparus]|uniref:START domain protein n=1 Tax=Dictyocaulus viviparus TaxID=29172 RepID=A0A0D8XC78_DICVI|nr:START domain protein [Dictyocaulus viviparus]
MEKLCLYYCAMFIFAPTVSLAMTSVTLHGVTDKLSPPYEKYTSALETAAAAFREVEALFNDRSFVEKVGWKVDEKNDQGDVVYAKVTPKGKMVSISTELPLDVDSVMNETWTGVERLPEWNPSINFARTVASPTPNFDIITYGNNDVLVVSGRDFVSARIYRKTSSGYILASRSVRLKEVPEQKGRRSLTSIRGILGDKMFVKHFRSAVIETELLLAGARFTRHPQKADVTSTDVVMQADLKGLLPKFVVNKASVLYWARSCSQTQRKTGVISMTSKIDEIG